MCADFIRRKSSLATLVWHLLLKYDVLCFIAYLVFCFKAETRTGVSLVAHAQCVDSVVLSQCAVLQVTTLRLLIMAEGPPTQICAPLHCARPFHNGCSELLSLSYVNSG
jgi:hypothetical protein